MIKLLVQRGTLIAQGKFDKLASLDEEINETIKKNKEELKTPVSAFVTFETQEGMERCENYLFKKSTSGKTNKKKRDV